jgi:hypothetical protein
MSYSPLYVSGFETGLVQSRQEFILPNDAYPVLENAFVWRERIKRKQGFKLLGRLRRKFVNATLGNSSAGTWNFNIYTLATPVVTVPPVTFPPNVLEIHKEIEAGSVVITIGATTFTDDGQGNLIRAPAGSDGTINYQTGAVSLPGVAGGIASTINFNYFPGLPVMGLNLQELDGINAEKTIAFDQIYAYEFLGTGWQEFIPGYTWSGDNSEFFWSTNYWTSTAFNKIFWVTNNVDPIRYTDTVKTAWVDFTPIINAAGDRLQKALLMAPFRGRMVVANTVENGNPYPQRIRWAEIGNPFSEVSSIVTVVVPDAWKDDIKGKGGYLDIPTSENITSMGFVRDNLVIFCERSTWQLRYTGRTIAPFQIERVNSELGSESTFSSVQFDTSLVGIGDKGIVECDSFKSDRIDIKIPNLIFEFNNLEEGPRRVHGIRDFIQKLAYWTYPFLPDETPYAITFPNRRLVYNYESDNWAIFTDSLTTLGTFQPQSGPRWQDFPGPEVINQWQSQNIPWVQRQALQPKIIGGNQQGFVEYLDVQTGNDVSLAITNVDGSGETVVVTSYDHNLFDNEVIQIYDIAPTDPFYALNNNIYGVAILDKDSFQLFTYNPIGDAFDIPVVIANGTYFSAGRIAIREGFSIVSKKFNFAEEGQNIQMGYLDVLMDTTNNDSVEDGYITCNVYLNYNDSTPVNTLPENQLPDDINPTPDSFFNSVVPTYQTDSLASSKTWQRVVCPVRGQFITIEWTLSNAQLVSSAQECNVQIDAQILYVRRAGKQLPVGF